MTINPNDFRNGAVAVRQGSLLGHINELIDHFPVAAEHRKALRSLGSDFVYARRSPIPSDRDSWIVLIRFGAVIEQRFGITREVLGYYSRHRDLQQRTYQNLPNLTTMTLNPPTPDLFLLWSPDPMVSVRLDDWSTKSAHVAIALPKMGHSDAASEIWHSLLRRLTQTNTYKQTLPVTGRDFFGRIRPLRELADHLTAGRVSGVFGLRKTGKTSLVKEFGRRVAETTEVRQIFVLRDLETLPSNTEEQVANLLDDIRVNLLTELRSKGLRTHELVQLPSSPTVAEFRRAIHILLSHIARQEVNVVLALDEIESLVGPATEWNANRPQAVELLGALRALVQENANFNVLVSGLTSSILEEGELFGRENPFFAWATTLFLPPLTKTESMEILVHLGRRMAVTWSEDAASEVAELADGHVFLLRTLAAQMVESLPADLTLREVTTDVLTHTRRQWRRSVAGQVHQMMASIARYYPTENDVLDLIQTSPFEIDTLEELYPNEINHLIQLGLVAEDHNGLRLTALSAFDSRHSRN
ncbi:ATP-binding protein [Kutzneria sp. NPDC051319]|uniref:ATP-binding protein n=1 Tax=Kutzneria sp. NPDC051319 TaxID=3155047 RepID=UPI00342AF277